MKKITIGFTRPERGEYFTETVISENESLIETENFFINTESFRVSPKGPAQSWGFDFWKEDEA